MKNNEICNICGGSPANYNSDVHRYLCNTCNMDLLTCGDCLHNMFENQSFWIDSENIYVCEDCFDNHYFHCNDCEEIFHNNNRNPINNDYYVCNSCYNNYFYCEYCETTYHVDYYADNNICTNCIDEMGNDVGENDYLIESYGYKPYFQYFDYPCKKNNCYTGIELEMDKNQCANKDACIEDLKRLKPNFFYGTKDCTCNGFELHTHPFSKQFYYNNISLFNDMLSICIENNFSGYFAHDAGLHVHVEKKYISRLDILKLLHFFYLNRNLILKVSQRTESKFNTWSPVDSSINDYVKIAKSKFNLFRGAIALHHEKTIEFRIFRSNLSQAAFHKNIEFIYSIIDFVKNNSIEHSRYRNNYFSYINKRKKDYKNLINFFENRNIINY